MENFYKVLAASYIRYFIFSGGAFFLFYYWKATYFKPLKIQARNAERKHILTELKYSLITTLIFAIVIYTFLFSGVSTHTRIYNQINQYETGYLLFSFIAIVFMHDTYFYWTHRLMHSRKLFRYVHRVHHISHNPTPLAAFSFHPLEALIEIGILPIIVFTLPVHRVTLLAFGLYMVIMNVIGHLGFELFPKNFVTSPLTRWINTATHHNMHHHYSKHNFGLYFNIWDRLMKTNHPAYITEFKKVAPK